MNEQNKIWYNDFAAEWYESMDRYKEERIREKQEIARKRYEEDWGFAHGIGPYGSAVFDSFDPWCDCWNGGYWFDLE